MMKLPVQRMCTKRYRRCHRPVEESDLLKSGSRLEEPCECLSATDSVPVLSNGCVRLFTVKEGRASGTHKGFSERTWKNGHEERGNLTEVLIPCDKGKWQGIYMKVGGRNALIISVAGAAILRDASGQFRVACGSVEPTV